MSPTGKNGQTGWRLVISDALKQRLHYFGITNGHPFKRALQVMWKRLQNDADVFGEPLYHLTGKPAEIRHAAVASLVIAFAAYREDRLVWLINAWLLSGTDTSN